MAKDSFNHRDERIKEIERELKELEGKPLENPKPQLSMHPFLDVVFRPGVKGFPVADPNPAFNTLLQNMHLTDWLYVGGATGYMLWRGINGSTRPLRSALLYTSFTFPLFFGVGLLNSYARLVGLKAMDDV